uniref:Fat storage inducing transmembrane protein 2 n=1 Tax=Neogobius melanostomus TaxID=47308 RepID=A0A8C6USJ5_9GOBI
MSSQGSPAGVTAVSNMEQVIVNKLLSFWRSPGSRRYFPWMFLIVSVVGSLLKEAQLVPDTYFSSSRNIFNLYFVKVSWGWTLLLLSPFMLLSNSCFSRDVSFLTRRLLALPVATAIWYVFTETFFYIEDVSGTCFQTIAMDAIQDGFVTKVACRRAGFHWFGYDISGHSFILTFSTLFIMEETAPMAYLKTTNLSAFPRLVLSVLYVALNGLMLLWLWMFCCTSVYFHGPLDKLLGTLCGLLGWYATYRLWYRKPLSPGLPPQPHARAQKQHP